MATIELTALHKQFETTAVITDVNLAIADGEFCVLVGPSGSGKSTLLRMIAGLETASSGRVLMGGLDVTHRAPKDRDIAMVFQSYALYPQMTVRENMGFGLKLLKRPAEEIRRRVDEAARMLNLESLMDRRPAALSGGQRQRVAMGRAMVRQPAAYLFDEPLSNLDAALRASVRGEIRALHQRGRTTSVYVTHDQVEAMTMGDRIAVMSAGRIEQAGTPTALYDRPVNRFVAGFIGSPAMNFVELPLQREAGALHARWGALQLPLPVGAAPSGDRVVLGVRPEHLKLAVHIDGAGDGDGVSAEVRAVEFTGAQSQVDLFTEAGGLSVCASDRPALRPGDRTRIHLPRQQLHFFDAGSGLRLGAVEQDQ